MFQQDMMAFIKNNINMKNDNIRILWMSGVGVLFCSFPKVFISLNLSDFLSDIYQWNKLKARFFSVYILLAKTTSNVVRNIYLPVRHSDFMYEAC